jgi:DNA repair protein RecO (recombination protein O)
MQSKTPAIVLHTTQYSDSASILTAYTLEYGRASYFVRNANKKKSSLRNGLLQPLTILDMNVIHQHGKTIHQIKDIHSSYPFVFIPTHPVKNAIALFIAELLYKTLRNEESQPLLYSFVENSIMQLDLCEEGVANFHLIFMAKLSRYLGFEASANVNGYAFFDLVNGVFCATPPLHSKCLKQETCADFATLLDLGYHNAHELILSRMRRVQLLEGIIEFYKLHIPDFKGLQSLAVLQSLFD